MRYDIKQAYVNQDVTVATPSNGIPTNNCFYASAQVIATGSPVGVVSFQASNDPYDPGYTVQPPNWTDIPSVTVSVDAAGTFLIPKFELCYMWIRAVYTATSGTGNVTVNVMTMGQ